MGTVVDSNFILKGSTNLRVVDLSVLVSAEISIYHEIPNRPIISLSFLPDILWASSYELLLNLLNFASDVALSYFHLVCHL